jgi:hypothetical protein
MAITNTTPAKIADHETRRCVPAGRLQKLLAVGRDVDAGTKHLWVARAGKLRRYDLMPSVAATIFSTIVNTRPLAPHSAHYGPNSARIYSRAVGFAGLRFRVANEIGSARLITRI